MINTHSLMANQMKYKTNINPTKAKKDSRPLINGKRIRPSKKQIHANQKTNT